MMMALCIFAVSYTHLNNTNPILSEDEDRMGYEKYFMEQLNIEAVSYTHLDVYKRQEWTLSQPTLNYQR